MSPDNRQHRGPHPEDENLFAADQIAVLQRATAELSWLMSRGYATAASLKLVGDRYRLAHRQRLAVSRAACSDESKDLRAKNCRPVKSVAGEPLIIDGFNLLITVEAALSRGLLLVCRDNCVRDLSSVHGSYRSVQETEGAIRLIGEALAELMPTSAEWLFDQPVSNSGRLAARVENLALARSWPWKAATALNPDALIIKRRLIAVTSDLVILDQVGRWINLNEHLVRHYLSSSWVIDLRT